MSKITPISLHGGHSGQFCTHAEDRLEDIVNQYIRLGFPAVGISEHAPPPGDQFLYPDEKEKGLTAFDLYRRFGNYVETINTLKDKYAAKIRIFAGMETETYTGYADHTRHLVHTFNLDYIVGSVHHLRDVCFDYSADQYEKIAADLGSIEAMYAEYFDLQHEMISRLKPFVVGHFDLIRIYDRHGDIHLSSPPIVDKIRRNLSLIRNLGLVLDYNLRPLSKGGKSPYVDLSILMEARKMGIPVVPGDDSHSVKEAGAHVHTAIKTLQRLGFDTQWPDPVLIT